MKGWRQWKRGVRYFIMAALGVGLGVLIAGVLAVLLAFTVHLIFGTPEDGVFTVAFALLSIFWVPHGLVMTMDVAVDFDARDPG